jgi:hypothetical protein
MIRMTEDNLKIFLCTWLKAVPRGRLTVRVSVFTYYAPDTTNVKFLTHFIQFIPPKKNLTLQRFALLIQIISSTFAFNLSVGRQVKSDNN